MIMSYYLGTAYINNAVRIGLYSCGYNGVIVLLCHLSEALTRLIQSAEHFYT